MSYVELHCHSCFSLREGASTPLELLVRARNLGYRELALTDHDNLIGAMQFAQTAKDWDLRPITGAEITLEGSHHLTLLAATAEGYGNLCRLLTEANLSGLRGEPRVRLASLAEHSHGLVALSGCPRGIVPALAEAREIRPAKEAAEQYATIFGRQNFFIELQRTSAFGDEGRNQALVDAVRLGLRYTAGVGTSAFERLRESSKDGAYFSLWDFWRRTQLPRQAIENLIRLGAFSFTGLHERELLWQLGTFYRPLNQQQPLALSFSDSLIGLREMTHRERVATDLLLSGIAVRGHSMDLIDDQMHEGIVPSHLVDKMEQDAKVTVGGLVAVRQAPETAKGFVFHTLEDRYGLVNVITPPALVPKYRQFIERAPALVVHGHIERHERAVNVIAERFESLEVASDLERRVHNFG